MPKIQRALISVTDKIGIADFARALNELSIEIISTGGTAKLLRDSGIPVRDVSEVTGFPEMLDGRVKTMHPLITGGILAIRENPEHMTALEKHKIQPIDLVVVNLYEFEKAAANPDTPMHELIEQIDIGGPTMIRSAAKNYQDVAIVTAVSDYPEIIRELQEHNGVLSHDTRWRLARAAFARTAAYDQAISTRLEPIPQVLSIQSPKRFDLRYGENPHQSAALYASGLTGVAGCEQLHGKELSYNNLVDLDAAWELVNEFAGPAAALIKHTNPSGCATQSTLVECYMKALECDPVSAFGSVIGFNREVDVETAEQVAKLFVEAIAAPSFSAKALSILSAKKNLRLVKVVAAPPGLVVKSISGGFLAQAADKHVLLRADMVVKTKRTPTEEEWTDLEFAWKVAKHVKSNAIVYVRRDRLWELARGR